MIKSRILLVLNLILWLSPIKLRAQHVELVQQNKNVSIRGLSVVSDNVGWISSSNGYVAITTNGGKSWNWQQVKGFEKSDFRDIEAFSDKEAIIMSSGTPAVILKTIDGGNTWKLNFIQKDSIYFLDAMDFDTPKHGIVLGDPINNHFLLMETNDRGDNWQPIIGPRSTENQAAFAASGTCIVKNKLLTIVTGGSLSEIITKNKACWVKQSIPLLHGQSSEGAFSIASYQKSSVVVGGDYKNAKNRDSTACYSVDNGLIWHLAKTFPSGYQSCAEHIDNNTFISTGTSGTNITVNGGKNWAKIDEQSYNVCRKAKHGNLVILAGDSGKIGILKL